MEKCLITNKICSAINRKCKDCKLDDCKEVINMCETQEKKKQDRRLILIKAQLPDSCRECHMLKILNLNKQIVYCPYMIKEECLIGSVSKSEEKKTT